MVRLPPLRFIGELRKRLQNPPLGPDWQVGKGQRSLRVEFLPVRRYLAPFNRLPEIRQRYYRFGPLAFYLAAGDTKASIIKTELNFYGNKDVDWKTVKLNWCYETLANTLRDQARTDADLAKALCDKESAEVKLRTTVKTWHFASCSVTPDEEVRKSERIIRTLAPVIKRWFEVESPRHRPIAE